MTTENETLVCDCQVQMDRSGVGHCWVNVAAGSNELPPHIVEEIEGEILDGGKGECDDFVASNGMRYRW